MLITKPKTFGTSNPNMPNKLPPPANRPMIVTAWIKPEDLDLFNRLRAALFPKERNYLSAHVTLFHHIPSAVRQEFIADCHDQYSGRPPLTMHVKAPFLLGGGVAYSLECEELSRIRAKLREQFAPVLTAQDDRPWNRPHITVQNKVDPGEAKRTLAHLQPRFEPCTIEARGLSFYRYDGGPWHLLDRRRFAG
ncbi:2'-5' RNA ligase family protein [Lewinella sp. IMCC34191]|uniref:2'-5' RNA ligase family protein n=1 Tax=Lewinella sp. IMCC34191 TaxID=2259172 RepID=UPI000E223867|nr:2'-5' RNA ligase family protein [Lewinella sp. IMCC34191]